MSDSQSALAGREFTGNVRHCGTPAHNRRLVASDPGYKSRRLSIQQFNRALRQGESLQPGFVETLGTGSFSIPIVFHVVYHTAEQNIRDDQIDSQVSVLNADFNAANADLANLPAVFKPLVGNAKIGFYRATRDPRGLATNGVTRTQTTVSVFDQDGPGPDFPPDDRMKFTSTGGADAWPSDRYLNIWVCDMGPSLLGYAQFPGGPPTSDGVAINFFCFGTTGTARAPTNYGRNATHEVGHWLDCFHIWGDDINSCSGTDHCDDTPNQAGNSGPSTTQLEPTFPHISCNNGPNGDLFYNHMDYTRHRLRIMFTKGQVARMHATLTGPRASIAGSDFFEFIHQSGTALHETDDTFKFLIGDISKDGQPDLVAIKKNGSESKTTEIHVLSGASRFQTFHLQKASGLHETSTAQFDFALTDWNGDGTLDLVAIKKNGTESKRTEVHILSGASDFTKFILQTDTALHETDDTFAFAMGPWTAQSKPDLFAIKKSKTDSGKTEVHILSGASEFHRFVLQTATNLDETDATFEFDVTDWNADGRPDLVAIKKSNTSRKATEVHVLSGASEFKRSILRSETALHSTDGSFQFAVADWTRDGRPDLIAIKKKNTKTNSTEVHVMAG